MKAILLAALAAISLSGCFATVGVVAPAPVYMVPAAPVYYVQPAPVVVYPSIGFGYYHRGYGHYRH